MKKFLPLLTLTLLLISVTINQSYGSCCFGERGNVNNSSDDQIDISDLLFIVDYMFIPGSDAPVCLEEADINGSGGAPDISDLLFLVDYMFENPAGPAPATCPEIDGLIFSDEFNGTSGTSPNGSYWDYDIGTDWGNAQIEYDTDRPINVSLDGNGNLAIIAREESYMGQPYTSARIVTRDLFEVTYGRVEARIKLPEGQGIWPAFWLLGSDISTVGWPQCGEIDVMEYLGHETNKVYGTVHGPGYSGGGGIGESLTLPSGGFNTDFHIFAIEWQEDSIKWFVDDSMYFSITPDDLGGNEWVFDHSFYIILNLAVGGTWPGYPDGTTVFPQTMLVDYVRVYQDSTYISTSVPNESASTPTADQSDVISIFSDFYTDVTVDTWSADWDVADVSDYSIGTDNLKRYDNLVYAGIEFASPTIDVSSMTHFHLDLWTADAVDASTTFKVKLVDFGANGVYDGGYDDVEHEISLNQSILATKEWVSIDIPISSFTNLVTKEHLAQLIISSNNLSTVFVDNIYFYTSAIASAPTTSAPTPTYSSADVISLFSDAYSNVAVDTWSAIWDEADVADFTLGSDNIKKYTNLVYAGIEFINTTVDASGMTHFSIDIWTPDFVSGSTVFKVKLVDFGANGVWDGGGDDVEHELSFSDIEVTSGNWITLDIPLSEFVNLTTREHMAQLIISGDVTTVFVDNIYFHK